MGKFLLSLSLTKGETWKDYKLSNWRALLKPWECQGLIDNRSMLLQEVAKKNLKKNSI